jgi:hypothetical protein
VTRTGLPGRRLLVFSPEVFMAKKPERKKSNKKIGADDAKRVRGKKRIRDLEGDGDVKGGFQYKI